MGIYDECPFRAIIDEWDGDDEDIITLLCEPCPNRDECFEKDYEEKEE